MRPRHWTSRLCWRGPTNRAASILGLLALRSRHLREQQPPSRVSSLLRSFHSLTAHWLCVFAAKTQDNGRASTTFPASALPVGGAYTLSASFAGDACLASSSAGPIAVPISQRTQVSVTDLTAVCG